MKKLIFAIFLLIPAVGFCGDDLITRPDIYGTPATQWNYADLTSTGVVKSSPGVLHCVTISSAGTASPQGFTVYDSSDSNSITDTILPFPSNVTAGNYCLDAIAAEGITVMLPVNGPKVTVTYR